MPKRIVVLLVFLVLIAPSIRSSAQAAPGQYDASRVAIRVVELVNAQRAAVGRPPVVLNMTLLVEAQRFSEVQARLGRLSHSGDDNSTLMDRLRRAGYPYRFCAENLAAGQASPDAVVVAWMASPGHRANILHPQAQEIGIGFTMRADDPAGLVRYWTMELGRNR